MQVSYFCPTHLLYDFLGHAVDTDFGQIECRHDICQVKVELLHENVQGNTWFHVHLVRTDGESQMFRIRLKRRIEAEEVISTVTALRLCYRSPKSIKVKRGLWEVTFPIVIPAFLEGRLDGH